MTPALVTKTPQEYKYLFLDLTAELDGDTVTEIISTTVTPSDSFSISAALNDARTGLFLWVNGGEAGSVYIGTIEVSTDRGETFCVSVLCEVSEYRFASEGTLYDLNRGTPPPAPANDFVSQNGTTFLLQDGSTLQLA
jgi:hypothetical protein